MLTTIGANSIKLDVNVEIQVKNLLKRIDFISDRHVEYTLKDGRVIRFLPIAQNEQSNMQQLVDEFMDIAVVNELVCQTFYYEDVNSPNKMRLFRSIVNYDYNSDRPTALELLLLYKHLNIFYYSFLSLDSDN